MKLAAPTLLLTALFVIYGPTIFSLSVDVASHYGLVREIMSYGHVRPEAEFLKFMQHYPPLAHWCAAFVGWIGGSGLVGMWLLSIAAIYASYYAVARLLASGGAVAPLVVYALLFWLLMGSRSVIGWEVIHNFFFPQLMAFAVYFLALWRFSAEDGRPLVVAAISAALMPVLFLTQPLAAIHLAGAACTLLFVEGSVYRIRMHRIDWPRVAGIAIIVASVVICLRLPAFRQILRNASHNGELIFYIPLAATAVLCGAASIANLALGLRGWPKGAADRVIGSAGVAAAGIMLMQYLALVVVGYGSPYAVKKHLFVVLALGMINAARLAGRVFPATSARGWAPYAASVLAFLATFAILDRPDGTALPPIITAERFVDDYAALSPDFSPGNTSVAIASIHSTANMTLTFGAMQVPLHDSYRGRGEPVDGTSFVIVDRSPDADTCAVWKNTSFAVVPVSCAR